MRISDSQVLITGGGRGIGRYLAEKLAGQANRVAVFERDEPTQREIAAALPNISSYLCDVTDPIAVQDSFSELEKDGFKVDVLVNNAGLIHSAPLINMTQKENRVHSTEAWRQVLDANLSSVFYVSGQVVDRLLKRRSKGVVITMSSISARGNAGQSAYSAAKAGGNALTRTWAKELGGFGIRFASIAPGFLDTPSTRGALSEGILSKLQQQIPLRRLGEVDHIYQTVRFIVENDYVNGTVLEIDGGLVM